LYFTGWNRVIRLENGIMVWEKGNIPTIVPQRPKVIKPLLKKAWGILPVSFFCLTCLLTVLYLYRFKKKKYREARMVAADVFPVPIVLCSAVFPLFFFTSLVLYQIRELLFIPEQKDPVTTVMHFYDHLDFQRFAQAYTFFSPTHTYTLDQFLLEKSVNEGGLLPSYAKLDSIGPTQLARTDSTSVMKVFTRWRTALGHFSKTDTLHLERLGAKWYIMPRSVKPPIPETQVAVYQYTVVKKMGKRLVSSFPAVKDDRIKKPFLSVLQAQVIRRSGFTYITGELLNADDVPVNLGLKAVWKVTDTTSKAYYPGLEMQYNIAAKGSTLFEIPLDSARLMDSLGKGNIELRISTDVSERGYVHGPGIGYTIDSTGADSLYAHISMFNELTMEANVPAVLLAEKDDQGRILQVVFGLCTRSLRPGASLAFDVGFRRMAGSAIVANDRPLQVFVDDRPRSIAGRPADQKNAIPHDRWVVVPDCFMSGEIYLQ
jgi:hypothetical protein